MSEKINPQTRLIVSIILFIATFISLTSQTMMTTAIPVIQTTMHQPLALVQWLTTGYTLIIGIITPLTSNLYEKYSNRSLFLSTIGIFIIGTAIGSLAPNFWLLLLGRLIQACAGGILMSFQMTAMITIYPAEKRGTIIGLSSLILAFGPAIGPTLAGFILATLGWRYLFILVLPFMIVVWLIGYRTFPNFTTPKAIKIETISVILSLLGTGLALSSLSFIQTQPLEGSAMMIVGLILIYLFAKRQLQLKQPMLKITIFKSWAFRMMTIIGILAFMILLGTEQMVSIYVQDAMHMSSMTAGLVLLPGAASNAITAAFVGRAYDNYGPKWLITSGAILMLIATIPLVTMTAHMALWVVTLAYALRMIGNALVFSPAMSEAFIELKPDEIDHATALFNAIRQMFAAVSITMLVLISSVPASLVRGMHWAMWLTAIFIISLLIVFLLYITKGRSAKVERARK